MFWFSIFIVAALLKFNLCEEYEILKRPLSNTVLVSNRINNVIIAVSKNCSEESYQNLLKGFIFMERQAWENERKYVRARVWITNVFIGKKKIILTNPDDLDKYFKCSDCNYYNQSLVDDVENSVSQYVPKNETCPITTTKEYTLVLSDICLPSLNKKFYNATDECSIDYREIGVLLETQTLVDKCLIQIKESSNNETFVDFFSENNLTINIREYIGGMKAVYYSKPIFSTVNFLVMINIDISFPFTTLRCKLYGDSYKACINGIFHGTSIYINGNSQNFSEMIIPLYFNDNINTSANYFMENYVYLVNNGKHLDYDEKNCSYLETFFLNARSSENKYNILILQDPYLKCFDFDLQWKYSYKHMEIMIIYSGKIKSFYSNETMNRVTFYERNDGYTGFCKQKNLCTATSDPLATTSLPPIITSAPFSPDEPSIIYAPIFGITAGIIVLLIVFFFGILIKKRLATKHKLKNIMSPETLILKKEVTSSCETSILTVTSLSNNDKVDCFKTKMTQDDKQWAMFLDGKNIKFTFNDMIGRGANAIVYKGILKGHNSIHLVQKCRRTSLYVNCDVAIKLPTKFEEKQAEEFMRELNFLMLLQFHTNIITLMGWTIFGEIPALVTELASTNLLSYVQSLKDQDIPLILSLQIILQVSQALECIAEQGIVHRDVAARNVLLMENNIAKLADFGLCCFYGESLHHDDPLYKRFPIKWLSIEALINFKFSEKSDIWAFGVLCYEMYSHGAVPYSDMSHSQMVEYLQSGQRLKKPLNTPYLIYDLMINCWNKNANERPTFNEIGQTIRVMLEKETLDFGYLHLATTPTK